MGAAGVNSTKSRRGRFGGGYQPMAEINVTPFVDVMMVLLVIFMVTAPLMTVGVPIDLPKTRAQQLAGDQEPLSITVTAAGQVYLQESEIPVEEVVAKLRAIAGTGYDQRIFVRGDARTDYGTVMKVMGTISAAGFRRIALVTDTEESR